MQLAEYLPFFVSNTKEFKELHKVLQPEIDNLFIEADNRLTDMFVLGSSEYAAKRYEKIVDIVPKLTDNLEKRQLDILAIYNEVPPFTYERVVEMLTSLLGFDGFKIYLDIPRFSLKVTLSKKNMQFKGQVNEMLERIVPVNIIIDYDIDWNTWGDLKTFTWRDLSSATWRQAKEDEKFNSIK